MSPGFTLARLAVREASRRRLSLALAGITLVAVGFSAWGFGRLVHLAPGGVPLTPLQVRLAAMQLLIFVMFMFSGILALGGIFLGAPAIAGDIESGVALAVMARPVARSELLLGRWLGLALLVAVYAAATTALEFFVVARITGYAVPDPAAGIAYMVAEGLSLLTLAVALSTRLAAMTAGITAAGLFFIVWIGGIVGNIGHALHNAALAHVGTFTRLVLPSDALWRGAEYAMEAPLVVLAEAQRAAAAANPFFSPEPDSAAYLAWVAVWFLLVLALALWSFHSREL